jgi:hypothetical protein
LPAGTAAYDTNIVWALHQNSYFRALVTNWGYFGNLDGQLRDSSGGDLPVFECPPNSGIEYLYDASLWIGGIVSGDTLVSTGSRDIRIAHEFYADNTNPARYSEDYGDVEWNFDYADTITDPETLFDDPYDGPHHPLPVLVHQKTYDFDFDIYKTALFIDMTVVNAGTKPIDSLWIGWLLDTDIGDVNRDAFFLDDLTGHTQRDVSTTDGPVPVSIAWAIDNDGDPDSMGQFDEHSPDKMLGSMYFGGTPRLPGESYNWFIPSPFRSYDWGPQRAPGDVDVFGGHGYPVTDRFRYRLMSNREIDYPQAYAAVDMSAQGWIKPPPDSVARDLADGFDTRFLHSVGGISLAPGDSVTLTWVWVLSPHGHRNPHNFADNFIPTNPKPYLDGLGISSMELLVADLKRAWDSSFIDAPIPPPRNFRVAGWTDSSAMLSWSPRQTRRLAGYRLGRISGVTITLDKYLTDTFYLDNGLDRATTYYYWAQSVPLGNPAAGSEFWKKSDQDTLLPDRPHNPARPVARGGQEAISLRWRPNTDTGLRGYNVYRRGDDSIWTLIASQIHDTTYTDPTVETAQPYEFRLTAVSQLQNESYPGPATSAVAFAFDGPPQILDYTSRDPSSLTDKDSVAAAWQQLMVGTGALYRDARLKDSLGFTLATFNPHPVTIVVSDGRAALPEDDEPLLNLYSVSQGATIVSGRDLFNKDLIAEGRVELDSTSIGYAAGIRAAYYPRVLLANPTRMNAEFIGARAVDASLPDLTPDPSRTAWGLNATIAPPGAAIPFVGYFEVDTSVAEVLYTYRSALGSSSPLDGKPVAVISKDPQRTLAVFAFPLSYIESSQAKAAVEAILYRMGYGVTTAGDADLDGAVDASDVVFLINYLYHDGYLPIAPNGDVNGDCTVDLLDVIVLSDHVFHAAPLPAPCPRP